MARYVDVDKYINEEFCDNDDCVSSDDCFICWARRNTEDVLQVVHAEWLPMTNPIEWFDGREHFECSNCGIYHAPLKKEKYCPYCGAKMDKE